MIQKIKVGLTSFGMSGKIFHAPLLSAHQGFQIKTIVERSKNDVVNFYPEIKTVKSIDELLSDNEIELIIVNTPDHTHYELTKQALEAEKHVIVEKPFTQTVTEGLQLISLAKSKNRLLSVFQNRRWDGDFLTVQKIISDGYLGRIVEFEAHFDRFRNYIQPNTWKEDKTTGTGTLYNLGSHLIDQALVLFGMPSEVFADIRMLRSGTKVDDFFELILYYESLRVALKASYLVKESGPRYIVNGTHGTYLKYGIDPQEDSLKNGILPGTPGWGTESENFWGILHTEINGNQLRRPFETLPGNYMAYYNNIYDTLVNKGKLEVNPEEALNVIKIIEASYKSCQLGKTIKINSLG
jgi:scyllo-inositol 2-dehydrogenase (NADP+)